MLVLSFYPSDASRKEGSLSVTIAAGKTPCLLSNFRISLLCAMSMHHTIGRWHSYNPVLPCAPAVRSEAEIALYEKPPQNADFPANGAAGFSYGVRLYRKQLVSVQGGKSPFTSRAGPPCAVFRFLCRSGLSRAHCCQRYDPQFSRLPGL